MTPAWAQRQEELLSDCVVSPDVFDHMVDRLRDFVVPYQHALETEASQRNVLTNTTQIWGVVVDPETGLVYGSDMNTGLWILRRTDR